MKDFREGQKVIATIEIEDKGQDFTELDVLENGILLGYSPMFSHGRLSLLGIGTVDGIDYHTFKELKENHFGENLKLGNTGLIDLVIYMKNTEDKDPVPWKADTLNYRVVKVKKTVKANRFMKETVK